MSPDLQAKLYAKYPGIFQDKDKPMSETCMCWGISCGDGWHDILDHLCASLLPAWTTNYKTKEGVYVSVEPPQVIADQVKEKMGTLRFYYHLQFDEAFAKVAYGPEALPEAREAADWYDAYYDGIVHMATVMSSRTCEETGKPGTLHVKGGWLRTLCPEEAAKQRFIPYVPPLDE
jgi:hypothetical protein